MSKSTADRELKSRYLCSPWTYPSNPPKGHVDRWWVDPWGPPGALVFRVRDTANRCAVCGHPPKRNSYRRSIGGLMACSTCDRLIEAREAISV